MAYPLSYRHLEEMMAERGVAVDHTNIYRWVQKFTPLLEGCFRQGKKQPVGSSGRLDETYIKIKGQWKYLYRAVDKAGQTVDFLLTAHRSPRQEGRLAFSQESHRSTWPPGEGHYRVILHKRRKILI